MPGLHIAYKSRVTHFWYDYTPAAGRKDVFIKNALEAHQQNWGRDMIDGIVREIPASELVVVFCDRIEAGPDGKPVPVNPEPVDAVALLGG